MQLSPTAYKHSDLEGRDPEEIVAEMIYSDDVDTYAINLPDNLWPSDSMILYSACAEAIELTNNDNLSNSLGLLITNDGMINDYDLEGETIMGSIKPSTAKSMLVKYSAFDGSVKNEDSEISDDEISGYFGDCISLLKWASDSNYAIVFHCG